MDSSRTSRITLRRVALMAGLAALLAPVGSAEAATKKKKVKLPVVTSVSPMNAEVNDVLTIRGRNFRPGRAKNTVVFKRDGARAIFVKADVATRKLIKVKLPARLEQFMANVGQTKVATRFRIRILASKFGKSFTSVGRSPMIAPDSPPPPPPPPTAAAADGDCDGDRVLNGVETDDDNDALTDDVELSLQLDPCKVDTDGDGLEDRWEYDCDRNSVLNRDQADDDSDLLDDALENNLGTDGCSVDTDKDGIEDGYEYQSAIDLNDDNYQDPNRSLPYPGKRPYPNPLFADTNVDYDGDGLWMIDEFRIWTRVGPRALGDMVYSDGQQKSRTIATIGYDKQQAFLAKAAEQGYSQNAILNFNGGVIDNWYGGSDYDSWHVLEWKPGEKPNDSWPGGWVEAEDDAYAHDAPITDVERYYYDLDYDGQISDDERDEDADGLPNWVEAHGPLQPNWWGIYGKEKAYVNAFEGTDLADPDTDGDGILDGVDDNDFDDLMNLREFRRQLVAGEVPAGSPDYTTYPEPTEQDGFGNWLYPGPPQTYVRFVMGNGDPDSILWNRPTEQAPSGSPLDDGPLRAWVQPFNPCLPDPRSRTCERHPNLSALYPPFDANTPVFNVYDSHFKFWEVGDTFGLQRPE